MRKLTSWQAGVLVGVAILLSLTFAAILYRMATLLLGDTFAQLVIGLAVVGGVCVGFLDYLSEQMRR